jgi:hypothetical protein
MSKYDLHDLAPADSIHILVREEVLEKGEYARPRSKMVFTIHKDDNGTPYCGRVVQYCGQEPGEPTMVFSWSCLTDVQEENKDFIGNKYYDIELLRKLWKSMVAHEGFNGKKYEVSKQ